ncbi:unnamed protein product [Rhizopus stolonifer]
MLKSTRKRTHLKPSQVAVLQETFMSNTLPDVDMRAHLARELSVSERTIQIWFQNRRAKARKSENTLEPNVRRGWIDIQKRPRSSSKLERPFLVTPIQPRAMSEGNIQDLEVYILIPVSTLNIGTWARFASPLNGHDLVCFADRHQLHWQVQDEGNQFRVNIPYRHIHQITLLHDLEIKVHSPPTFSMKRLSDTQWIQCDDFTENQQASRETIHRLQGDPHQLNSALQNILGFAPQLSSRFILNTTSGLLPWLEKDTLFSSSQWVLDSLLSENHMLSFI